MKNVYIYESNSSKPIIDEVLYYLENVENTNNLLLLDNFEPLTKIEPKDNYKSTCTIHITKNKNIEDHIKDNKYDNVFMENIHRYYNDSNRKHIIDFISYLQRISHKYDINIYGTIPKRSNIYDQTVKALYGKEIKVYELHCKSFTEKYNSTLYTMKKY